MQPRAPRLRAMLGHLVFTLLLTGAAGMQYPEGWRRQPDLPVSTPYQVPFIQSDPAEPPADGSMQPVEAGDMPARPVVEPIAVPGVGGSMEPAEAGQKPKHKPARHPVEPIAVPGVWVLPDVTDGAPAPVPAFGEEPAEPATPVPAFGEEPAEPDTTVPATGEGPAEPVPEECPEGTVSYFKISKFDPNRCFLACPPKGLCAKGFAKNDGVLGSCKLLGYHVQGEDPYQEEQYSSLGAMPFCKGIKVYMWLRTDAPASKYALPEPPADWPFER